MATRKCQRFKQTKAGRRCASYGSALTGTQIQDCATGLEEAFAFYAERVEGLDKAIEYAAVEIGAHGEGYENARRGLVRVRQAYNDAIRNYDNSFITEAVVGLGDVAIHLEVGWAGLERQKQRYGG